MRMNQWLAVAGIAALCLSAGNVMAQGQGRQGGERGGERGGGFDPAQMQQRMMDGVRDRLGITSDAEWQAMQPLVQKVMDLRREQLGGMGRGMMGSSRGGGPQGTRTRLGGEPTAEEAALSSAIESNASPEVLRARMDAVRKAKAAKEAGLKAAQDNLKKVLTARQEAIALEMGLVN